MIKSSCLLVTLVMLAVAGGCGKKPDAKEPAAARTPVTASVADDANPAPPPPPTTPAPDAPAPAPESQPAPTGTETEGRSGFLNRVYSSDPKIAIAAMNQFIEGRSMTATTELKSFEQLVKEGGWPRTPKAPAGYRYILDPNTRLVTLAQ